MMKGDNYLDNVRLNICSDKTPSPDQLGCLGRTDL